MTIELPDGCEKAMDAIFELCEIITKHGLTVNDLTKVCCLAIDQGHDMMQIHLAMVSEALRQSKSQTENLANT